MPEIPTTHEDEWPIRRRRRELGLTLEELGAKTKIDPAHLDLIERGSEIASPTAEELEAIAKALGVNVDDLRR